MLQSLGLIVSMKSVLEPTQVIDYLGFLVKSREMKLLLPRKKLKGIIKNIQQVLNKEVITVRQLASVLGKLQATAEAIYPARIKTNVIMYYKNQLMQNKQ